MDSWIIICPNCDFHGGESDFSMSLCDECWCPQCRCEFVLSRGDEADNDDEE